MTMTMTKAAPLKKQFSRPFQPKTGRAGSDEYGLLVERKLAGAPLRSCWGPAKQTPEVVSGGETPLPKSENCLFERLSKLHIKAGLIVNIISEVSKTEGRVGQTTNVVIGGTVTDDATNEWVTLDQKVNVYPTFRGFTAIGIGGDDFVQAMVVAVESVLQTPVPEGKVKQKISSGGKYVSVNIGPVQVVSSEQVQAIYNAMRRDDRMKYFL